MYLRGIFEELMFYLSGSTNNKVLTDKNVNIWNDNTSREFLDKRGLNHYIEGDMGETYGFNFRHFGAEYLGCEHDYSGCGYDQLENAIHLIKNDPTSRRIIINLWNPSTLEKASLPSCLYCYQFNVDITNKRLDVLLIMRSSDFFLANNWNVCTGAFLVHLICNLEGIDLTPGNLHMVCGDTHVYENHIEAAKELLTRNPKPFPKLWVKHKKKKITDFTYDDMELLDYYPYKNIPVKMAI
jgi:thymidylate synthase